MISNNHRTQECIAPSTEPGSSEHQQEQQPREDITSANETTMELRTSETTPENKNPNPPLPPTIRRSAQEDAFANEKARYKMSFDLIDQYTSSRDIDDSCQVPKVPKSNTELEKPPHQAPPEEKATTVFHQERTSTTVRPGAVAVMGQPDEKEMFKQDRNTAVRPGAVAVVGPGVVSSKLHDFNDEIYTAQVSLVKDYDKGEKGDCETGIKRDTGGTKAKQGDEKSGSGVTTESVSTRRLRERATAPGVEFVRQRAPGMRPSWYMDRMRRAASEHAQLPHLQVAPLPVVSKPPVPTVAESQWTSMKKEVIHRRKWYISALVIVVIVIAVAVGVIYAVNQQQHHHQVGSITKFDAFSQDCNAIKDQLHPHVLSQCLCYGRITTVASDILAHYKSLSATFVTKVYPDFHESWDSCSPQNQALLWLASGDGSPPHEQQQQQQSTTTAQQRYSAALLFLQWSGQNWTVQKGWLSATDECSWFGLACDNQKQVVKISLGSNNLTGELAVNATLLMTSLTSVDLSQNQIHGSIASEWSMHSSLTKLLLDNNQLNGTLPTELGKLSTLQDLKLANNRMSGPLPTEFGQLQSLRNIDFSNNALTGQLPSEMGRWNTAIIHLDNNNFTGSTIPTEIGLISNLESFVLSQAGIKGAIPTELFRIGAKLTEFVVSVNSLTGTIPTEVGHAVHLTNWLISENNMTGTIPTEFGLCTQLVQLELRENDLTGTIPSELGLLSDIVYFTLDGNNINGTVPKTVCDIPGGIGSCMPNLQCIECKCHCP